MRGAARRALFAARATQDFSRIARPVGQGAGDVTYGIDEPAEHVLSAWLDECAAEEALSLLTEDAGWRHRGPDGRGGVRALTGFDHGGPRIVVDPIDGTRNLMTDLRSAWSVVGLARAGASEPWQRDIVLGILSEIPDTRAASFRRMLALRGEPCTFEERALESGASLAARMLDTGSDARVDHGYFPFFKYMADLRAPIAAIEADFLARLAQHEGADVRNCYDDQYISNGGQLALLALGSYRMLADLRAWLAQRRGRPTLTTKPYDIAGALICAESAGVVITAVDGGELDFPIDVTTPIAWLAWVNRATRARCETHLRAVLDSHTRSSRGL